MSEPGEAAGRETEGESGRADNAIIFRSLIKIPKRIRSGSSLKIEMSKGRPNGKPDPEREAWPAIHFSENVYCNHQEPNSPQKWRAF